MAETTKMQVFTYDNLALYDELLKNYVDAGDAKSLKTFAMEEGTDGYTLKFYRSEEPLAEGAVPAYKITIPKTDLSDVLSRLTAVETKASDNANAIATLNGADTVEGSVAKAVKDSADSINAKIGTVAEGKTVVEMIADAKTQSTYDDTQVKADIKANADAIAERYTKGETNSAITTAIANADHLKRSIVDALPGVADADEHTIYMVAIADGSGNQKYEEFMLINSEFEKIGDSAVDLTDYAKKTEVETAKADAISTAATDATTKADQALTDAKSYADGLNTTMDSRVTAIEGLVGSGYEPISEASIKALFA